MKTKLKIIIAFAIVILIATYAIINYTSTTLSNINLWNPTHLFLAAALITSYLLGIVHGVTPDEHTWPITFSYAVGSGTTKGGMKAGLIFSSGFTVQRALMSEIAYFALAGIFMTSFAFGIVYVLVGIAMFAAGVYIKRKSLYPHWHWLEYKLAALSRVHGEHSSAEKLELQHKKNPITSDDASEELRTVPGRLAFIHGLIAGFGFGAFALIIYTVIAPSMPSPWLGFLPGLLFGLGTMTMQIAFGAVIGRWLSKVKKLTKQGTAYVARAISSDVLFYGGIAFLISGLGILAFPSILNYGINTGIHIHNLDNLNIGFFVVIFVVVIISALSYRRAMKHATKKYVYGKAARHRA